MSISRAASYQLLDHLQQPVTTTCRLLKITLRDGRVFGLTTLDKNVDYDDGDGEVSYIATNGFDSAALAAQVGTAVANSEGYALLSDEIPGITKEMVDAGELDDAEWVCYLVNFEDLTMGHMVLDAGDLGEVRMRDGLMWIPELLSYMMRLKQPVGHVWSIRCRAVFGSAANSPTGCGVDLASLWTSGTVTSVGAETNRTFTGDAVGSPAPFPGVVEWLTGDNDGQVLSVESVATLTVSLNETTKYPIQVGDTYRIRRDCAKRYKEDCIGVWSNGVNFKGEPHIPVGDAAQLQTPGAKVASDGPKFTSGA